jgi:hypothetical protein
MKRLLIPILGCMFLVISLPAAAQEKAEAVDQAPKTIAQLTEDSERVDGLFTLFRNKKTGAVHLLIKQDQLNKEFIYFAQADNGVVQSGYFRGDYLVNEVISVRRHYDRIELVAENTKFYFDPANAVSRAADANRINAILAVEKIAAEDPVSGEMLIAADKLFLSESLMQIKPSAQPGADPAMTYSMGSLSEEKSKITALRSYPDNTDVEVEYVYQDPAPRYDLLLGADEITDPRMIAVRVMHSFIKMPENDFQPRRDDPRVGYFGEKVTDLTSNSATPYRDVITRWNLVKKDPAAEVSDPVEPIVWWIENTTPVEWRELIKGAAESWNQSFEKAGFSNALVVKIQPDDAEWDAGDIRYNVLRWTSSPTPPFGGYGPSFSNPRTGQLIGADIMLEYSFINRHLIRQKLMQPVAGGQDPSVYCSLGHGLKLSNMLGYAIATSTGMGSEMEERIVHDAMHYLILHELGHTLGLNHNMKATQVVSREQAFDPEFVATHWLAGSVMDYPAVNFAPLGKTQTDFYQVRPGPYDDWAIEYGYSTALADPVAEEARLQAILSRSTEPELAFGNDADDMRAPGKAIDPRVNIYDMSSDAIGYAEDRIALLRTTLDEMEGKYREPGASFQELYDAFQVVMSEWGRSAAVISRYIGGVYVDRAMVGQEEQTRPFTPVDLATQQSAMLALGRDVFAPDAFDIPPELYAHLQQQRRFYDFYETTEDPKIHDAVLTIQRGVLDHLLHPVVLKRITDSRLYGNNYPLAMFMDDLTAAIFDADLSGNVNTFRQNLQMDYVQRLAAMVRDETRAGFDTPSQSMAMYQLTNIRKNLGKRRGMDDETRAHTQNLVLIIDRALETLG